MKWLKVVILSGVMALGLGPAVHAVQVQTTLQGYLTDSNGNPYTSPQSVEFKVYQGGSPGTAGSGALVYDEKGTVSPAASGVFSYVLGSGSQVGSNPLAVSTFDTALPVYVEINVGNTTLLPRLQLTGTPYSAIAGLAENLKPVNLLTTNGLTAQTGAFSAVGGSTYSLTTASGVYVASGGVTAQYFIGAHYGDGSNLTGVTAFGVTAANIQPGTLGPNVLVPVANLTAGPLSAGILPGTVAYTNQANTFTAGQTVAGNLAIIGTNNVLISSGIAAPSGATGVNVSSNLFVSGLISGNGGGLINVQASNIAAANVTAGTLGSGVLLPAGNLTGGPLTSEMLPTTVAYTNQANTYSQPQTFSGGITATTLSGTHSGDGSNLTGIGGAAPIGSIIAFAGGSEPSGWIECDGRSLPQSGTSSAGWGSFSTSGLFSVIGTVWGSSGGGAFNIPDLRGIFPRGWNHGKSSGYFDPGAASRGAQYTSGITGDHVGSYQQDKVGPHTHPLGANGVMASGPYQAVQNQATGRETAVSDSTTETTVKNAYVMYIIRVR